MKVLFATALLAVAEATQVEAQHGSLSGYSGYSSYAAPSYYGKKTYVSSYAKPAYGYKSYNRCGHHTDSSSDSDSDCGFYTSDYSDNDHGYGDRTRGGRSYYYKYVPRYYNGAYRYGRKYATYGGKYGYATYFKQYRDYPVRSYRPSSYYYTSSKAYRW